VPGDLRGKESIRCVDGAARCRKDSDDQDSEASMHAVVTITDKRYSQPAASAR